MTSWRNDDKIAKDCGIDQSTIDEWEGYQNVNKDLVIKQDSEELTGLKYVAGLDISYPLNRDDIAFATIAICTYPELEFVHEDTEQIEIKVPYVPGYLAFREAEPLVKLVKKVQEQSPEWLPQLIIIDGNGLLHPREFGVACQIGLLTNIPTIGAAKNLYHIEGMPDVRKEMLIEKLNKLGDHVDIHNAQNEIIGMALKTSQEAKNPIYISIGHKISLETCKKLILSMCKYRVPEPIRKADFLSREKVRSFDDENNAKKVINVSKCVPDSIN